MFFGILKKVEVNLFEFLSDKISNVFLEVIMALTNLLLYLHFISSISKLFCNIAV